MYERIEVRRAPGPSLANLFTELPRTLAEISSLPLSWLPLSTLPKGDGHTVMVSPGFLASDESTRVLRYYLKRMGYDARGWGLGRNTGRFDIMAKRLPDAFLELAEETGEKISLIGQSLGGVFSRELARLYPDQVRQVISLGSPIQMEKSEAVAAVVSRMFEQSTGMSPEEMKEALEYFDETSAPPVPMTAIYSKGDGVVHWCACMEQEEGDHTQNIRVCGSHCGMGFNASIYHIIADRLAQAENAWQKYQRPVALEAVYS